MTTTLSEAPVRSAVETAPREALHELQLRRLRTALARRELVEHVETLEDVCRLPFTVKADLRASYPLGMMTVAGPELVRLHSSTGTSGRPTLVGHTRADLDVWAELMARTLACAGVRPGMVVHNAYPYGLTTGGFGFQQGAERLGATVVPAAGASLEQQAALIRDLGAQVLCCPPSFAVQLAGVLDETPLEIGLFGGEMWTPVLGERIESALGLKALNTYGLSEVIGPGVASECHLGCGMHVNEDHFLVEVVDPGTLQPVPAGELGELVITTLTREAMPLIRYRTGDLTSLIDEPCACGRTTARLRPLLGRIADVLQLRGVAVYPSQIEQALLAQPGLAPIYQLVAGDDDAFARCEPLDASADRPALAERVRAALLDRYGLDLPIVIEPPGALPRTAGKAVRVIRL
ncbi:phenylacetate--CoA ligase [Solirubrobacter sp. CPCC 204708]|uniref:Phenylacetate--CoA ligase n=1 Tax=Solirubrobacter deserti TaxID=2282478 RepID=A0ABT4RJI2_9ACTN|nr:phenylacetate--CoA ligase [Solirubrobacter deserti]MBE2319814.1 phenylacetate--CoA ligase [Solirubrobacter deserti]MDA0138705.1 phenylacetate--CoA ligase [Solirubrobacter deserti]